jgi:agmatinase
MLLIKVPGLNGLSKTKGSRDAGNAIISSLDSKKPGKIEEIHVDNDNLEEQNRLIYENSLEFLKNENKIVFLGGDHSISFSIGKAFLEYCKNEEKESCLIVFDAHADCMKPGKEPTHEEWLRGLVEQGFPAENVLLVGARKTWKEEEEFLKEKKIRQISISNLSNNLEEVTDTIMEFSSGKKLYVSLDIDVVDPAFAPATGYKEVGGLTSSQIIYIISRLSKMKNLKAVDIVEVDVEKDKKHDHITTKLASKLLGELL